MFSMIRLKNLHQVIRPVILPSPDKECFRKFPIFWIPATHFPIDDGDDTSIFYHNILRSKVAMCKDNRMGLREHSIEKAFDMAFWCTPLVSVKKCYIEIFLRLKRTFAKI